MRSFAIVLATALLFGCAAAPRGTKTPERLSFALPDLDGRMVSTGTLAGRVVLVDLWATWCKPCEHSMPFYAELQERYAARGLSIIAVSVDLRDDDVRSFLARKPLPFTVLRDPEGKVPAMLDVAIETMPTAVLLDREGRIVHVHAGFVDEDKETIESRVLAVLGDAS